MLRITACCVFLLFVLVTFAKIRQADDGHLIYALDDPYIHLALSDEIAHGHYGINSTEFSSPSSSILWPFLLAPFAGHAVHPYVPLLLSIPAGLIAAYLLAVFVERCVRQSQHGSIRLVQLAVVVLLLLIGNLISLPFLGLEHEVQVLLVIAAAMGLCYVWEDRPMPWWSLAAAAVGPLVRYENALVMLAVVLTLTATRRFRQATLVFAAAAVPVAAFSVFLRHLGLMTLPSSVLVKKGHELHSHNAFAGAYELAQMTAHSLLHDIRRWPIAALALVLTFALVRQAVWRRRVVIAAALIVAVLHLIFGGFGWFHRYEVYAVIFATMIVLRVLWTPKPLANALVLTGLGYLAIPYIVGTLDTPAATREIYGQQFQMHRFLNEYYRQDVAVDDLGLVSYGRPAGVYVLDLGGLAWYEAAISNRTPTWLEKTVRQRGVGLVMVHPNLFTPPASWDHIGDLCTPPPRVVSVGRCIAFYGTTPAGTKEIQAELRQFVPTLRAGATFTFTDSPQAPGTR